jgi:hypothetical protein
MKAMDSSLSHAPTITPLRQWALMVKETHDALKEAGFEDRTATDITIGICKRG